MQTFTIVPDGPFSLAAAAAFGFGPHSGRPKPEGDIMRLAFVADDFNHQAGVVLRQDENRHLQATVQGVDEVVAIEKQVRRILSLNHSGKDWLKVGERDKVIGQLQHEHPGLRPVLFHSPYEAAAWSIISLRRHRTQAAALRRRLAQQYGKVFELDGEQLEAFPLPTDLLKLSTFPGLELTRIERLHAVAQAALDGKLDAEKLLSMPPEEALTQLQELPGIGPLYAGLILLRSTGATDILTAKEPRTPAYIAHFYDLPTKRASAEEIQKLAEAWRPFRTWATVLIRVAGDQP